VRLERRASELEEFIKTPHWETQKLQVESLEVIPSGNYFKKLHWYECIRSLNPELVAHVEPKIKPLLSVAQKDGVPLILDAHDVPVELLRDERGGSPRMSSTDYPGSSTMEMVI
jgi:hypothetical protein